MKKLFISLLILPLFSMAQERDYSQAATTNQPTEDYGKTDPANPGKVEARSTAEGTAQKACPSCIAAQADLLSSTRTNYTPGVNTKPTDTGTVNSEH